MSESNLRSSWKSRMLVGVSAIVIVLVTLVLLQVDNWTRDFSENHAETSSDAKDPLLKPQQLSVSLEEAEKIVRETARGIPRWDFVERKTWDNGQVWLYYTRKTMVFRFVDDVIIKLIPAENAATHVELESQSRIGKGDLGQNPRNIKEFARALAERNTSEKE